MEHVELPLPPADAASPFIEEPRDEEYLLPEGFDEIVRSGALIGNIPIRSATAMRRLSASGGSDGNEG